MERNDTPGIPVISSNSVLPTDLNIPSSEGSLGLTVPPTEFEAMCRDLLKSGDISSDGYYYAEFSIG